jgi:hypothetical protein
MEKDAKRIAELIDNERYFEPQHPTNHHSLNNIEKAQKELMRHLLLGTNRGRTTRPNPLKKNAEPSPNDFEGWKLVSRIHDKRYAMQPDSDGLMDLTVEWIAAIALQWHIMASRTTTAADPQ